MSALLQNLLLISSTNARSALMGSYATVHSIAWARLGTHLADATVPLRSQKARDLARTRRASSQGVPMSFRALVLSQSADRKVSGAVETLSDDRLPAGDVTVTVAFSTLNYKDGLVLTSGGGLVRSWPHVGGIDLAGSVESSDNPDFKPGDHVVLNGWRVGELHWGGYATKARVKGDWLVKLPSALSPRRAMAIGTAGYTAMLCVMALEKHGLKPAAGEVLVTGAAGGVGSVAVAVLAKLGFTVVAAT